MPTKFMQVLMILILLFCAIISVPVVHATENGGGYYPNGAEGFMSGALPPPGVYVIEYLNHYWSNGLRDGNGKKLPIDFKLNATAAVTRVLWQTDVDVLGGKLGTYALFPLVHLSVDSAIGKGTKSGLGDITVAPYISWHFGKNLHAAAALDIVMPTGAYDKNDVANLGRNYWTFEPILAVTYLSDSGIELSGKFMYDFNTKNTKTSYKSGKEFHIDYAVGYHTGPWTFGLTGYYYKQVTGDRGEGATLGSYKGQAIAVGPSIKYDAKGTIIEAKYQKEFAVENKPRGDKIWVKLIWPL